MEVYRRYRGRRRKPDFVQRRVAVAEGPEPSIEGVQLALGSGSV
jgi:hypothetical protein